jgi:hypothetical protein
VEVVVRKTNLQRVVDLADLERPRGARFMKEERDEDHVARAQQRARSMVRSWCLRVEADRMVTLGTRASIGMDVLLTRFRKFVEAYRAEYQRLCGADKKFLYCAVPELHTGETYVKRGLLVPERGSQKDHFHLHVATCGFFRLDIALRIWHALCAKDDPDHLVNGSINVKRFFPRSATEDVPSVIAGYIAKYVGKSLQSSFNKKSYWASRIGAQEVRHIIMRCKTVEEAQAELSERFCIPWTAVLLTHAGCFFPLPCGGFWLKLTPEMDRPTPLD